MAINITSDSGAQILKDLGENPSRDALLEHAKSELGLIMPVILPIDVETRYVVTLRSYDEQDNFYDEMESAGSRGYVPERKVQCLDRMPICRSTTYSITPIEAARLELDPRVMAVELDSEITGIKPRPLGAQYSAGWDKSGSTTSSMNNWGLLRSTNVTQIPGWGSDGTPNQTATITTTSTGKNVDCVVFDGNILPGHPEYARNPDGTGGSRVNQFNWWSLNPQVTGEPAGTYNYSAGSVGNNGHGIHVAGIMCGNTDGWARNANIYNISPYGEQTNGTTTPSLTQLVNYIRYWHNNVKTVNPATGRKNPTVVNMSFGFPGNYFPGPIGQAFPYTNNLVYRGTATGYPGSAPAGQTPTQAYYNGNWSVANFLNAGVQLFQGYIDAYGVVLYFYASQDAAADQAIVDGMAEGIIWCAAGGNNWDESGFLSNQADYNNTLNRLYAIFFGIIPLYNTYYHNRLTSPAHAASGTPNTAAWRKCIVSANLGTLVNEQLDDTSQSGPAIDVVAPGSNIMSSYNSGVTDPRNPAYFLAKLGGTSMASPQTAGVIACVAEQYPNMTQMQARTYMQNFRNLNAMFDPNIQLPPNNPIRSLRGAENAILTYYPDRPINGNVWPQKRSWLRPSSGCVYPRYGQQYRPVV